MSPTNFLVFLTRILCIIAGGKAVALRDRVRIHTWPLPDRLIGGDVAAAGGGLGQAGGQVRGPR